MRSFSLRTKIGGILILSVVTLAITTGAAFISFLAAEKKEDERKFVAAAAQDASLLADTILPHFIDNDFAFMNSLISRYGNRPSCAYVGIVDTNQRIMSGSTGLDLGGKFSIPALFESYAVGAVSVSKYRKTGKEYLDFSCPVKAGDLVLGAVRIGLNSDFSDEAARSLKKAILVSGSASAAVVALGILLSFWVVNRTVVPLLRLKRSAERVGAGDYDQVVQIPGDDEVGMFARSFNTMVRELKISRARLVEKQYVDSIIAGMRDALFVLTPDGSIRTVNQTALALSGYDEAELIDRPFGMMFGEPDDAGAMISELRDKGQIAHVERTLRSKSGKTVPVLVSGSVMTGDAAGFVCVATDITEQKNAREELWKHREHLRQLVDERTVELKRAIQELKEQISERERMEAELVSAQKLESIGILAGGIAHDFNNLLTTILANISMAMLDVGGQHAAHTRLRRAEQASLRAQDLTQQLLTFSRGGAPVRRIASLGAIIRESAEFALRGSRVRCDVSVPDGLWLAEVDEGQISQVMHNLVINADQAMPEGGTITISCENAVIQAGAKALVSPGRYVKVTVRDSGVGIAKEHLSKIFDPYFTTKQRGSGLGLATSYSIIQKHGGSIAVESRLGAGTAFTILLPASEAAGAVKRPENAALRQGRGKILIMEDNHDLRQTCSDALTVLGYSAVSSEDGVRAIELYREAMRAGAPFDAVIMDLTVPGGMGGKEAIRRLLEIDPNVKAVVSSGYSNDPVMSEYRDHGFAAVVAKPYRIEQLAETISRVLGGDTPGSHETPGAAV